MFFSTWVQSSNKKGGQPHQNMLDFGLSNEEIKILKIIFRLVRKMSSDK